MSPSKTNAAARAKRRRLREKSAKERAIGHQVDPRTLWEIHGGRCILCTLPVPFDLMTVEHKLAISEGGTHDLSNLGPAHRGCNSSKGTKTFGAKKRPGLRRSKPLRRTPFLRRAS